MTSRDVQKRIIGLSFPTMLGFWCQSLYDMVDMIFIGMLGKEAIAATTIFVTLFWTIEVLNEIVGGSSVSMISQAWGRGDLEKTREICQETITFKVLLAILGALALGSALPFIYQLYSTDRKVIEQGLVYGTIRLAFLPMCYASYSLNTIFRCTGDAKRPMCYLLVASVLNIILDPVCMFDTIPGTSIPALGMGIAGAAWATVISISVSVLLASFSLFFGKAPVRLTFRGLFQLHPAIDRKLLTIALPSGLELFVRNFAAVLILGLIGSFGTATVAVFGVAQRIYMFASQPSGGIAMGSGILVGHAIGASDEKRALTIVRLTSLDSLCFSFLLGALLCFFPRQILSLFLGFQGVSPDGVVLMRLFVPCLFALALESGLKAAFNGSGVMMPYLTSSLCSQWLIQIPYAFIIHFLFPASTTVLWLSFLLGDTAHLLAMYRAWKRGSWIGHRV